MILFPNCKINLGLRVTGKREDGYHDIETIFFPLPLHDAAELTIGQQNNAVDTFSLQVSGAPVPGDIQQNLCYKAWQLIARDHPNTPYLQMHLLKAIPTGAGLGGGSSDGAHTLLLLNQLLHLELSREQLLDYALELGSDCPFFIINKPCVGKGRGEQLQEIDVDLSSYYFVLVSPDIHISTAWAFSKLNLNKKQATPLEKIISFPATQWKDLLVNDFEEPVFEQFDSLKQLKQELYEAGAVYVSLTGTGSCMYGIFKENSSPDLRGLADRYTVHSLKQHR